MTILRRALHSFAAAAVLLAAVAAHAVPGIVAEVGLPSVGIEWLEPAGGSKTMPVEDADATAAPEPGALAMVLAGVGVLGTLVLRRRPQR